MDPPGSKVLIVGHASASAQPTVHIPLIHSVTFSYSSLLLTPPSSLCAFTFWRPPLLSSLLLQAHRPRITATSHLEFRCRSHILPRCLATDLTAVGPAFVQPCCYNRAVLFGGTSDDALAAQHAAPG